MDTQPDDREVRYLEARVIELTKKLADQDAAHKRISLERSAAYVAAEESRRELVEKLTAETNRADDAERALAQYTRRIIEDSEGVPINADAAVWERTANYWHDNAVRLNKDVTFLKENRDAYASEALIALSGVVCTPEKGFVLDGGPQEMAGCIRELRRMFDGASSELTALQAKLAAMESERDELKRNLEGDCLSEMNAHSQTASKLAHVVKERDAALASVTALREALEQVDVLANASCSATIGLRFDGGHLIHQSSSGYLERWKAIRDVALSTTALDSKPSEQLSTNERLDFRTLKSDERLFYKKYRELGLEEGGHTIDTLNVFARFKAMRDELDRQSLDAWMRGDIATADRIAKLIGAAVIPSEHELADKGDA